MESDKEIKVGDYIIWTDTGSACACGGHETFGKRTLAGIREADMEWPPPGLGANYIIIGDRKEGQHIIDTLRAERVLDFPEHNRVVQESMATELASVIEKQIMPMLRAGLIKGLLGIVHATEQSAEKV